VRQIRKDMAALGTQDDNILPIPHHCRNVTFFTQDQDFFTGGFATAPIAWSGCTFAPAIRLVLSTVF
jgi:hypothetical protein